MSEALLHLGRETARMMQALVIRGPMTAAELYYAAHGGNPTATQASPLATILRSLVQLGFVKARGEKFDLTAQGLVAFRYHYERWPK